MWRVIASGALFQVAWLVCVLAGSASLVLAYTLINLAVHLRFIADLPREPAWLVVICLAGIVLDGVMFLVGVLQNSDGSTVLPFWLVCLWLNFAMALRYSFAFLQRNLVVAAALGALAGPFSYFSGAMLNGDVSLQQPLTYSLSALALTWGLFLPLAAALARSAVFAGSISTKRVEDV